MKDNRTFFGAILLVSAVAFSPFVSSETYFVVGSYNDKAKAETAQRLLAGELGVQITIAEVEVTDIMRYRLMYADSLHSENIADSLSRLGIKPWRITLKEEIIPLKPATAVQQKSAADELNKGDSVLVAEFRDISEALALERKLGGQSLPVSGKAIARDGNILHQVWVGPVSNPETVLSQLKAVELQPRETVRSVAQNSLVTVEPQVTKPVPVEKKKSPSKKYPTDFNLARLPKKKPKP